MNFYSRLFAGGLSGDDENEKFKLLVSKNLTEVTEEMLDGITKIKTAAFAGCSSLPSITIPASVTSIGRAAFQECTSLTSVTVRATTPPTLVNSNAFSDAHSSLKIYVPSSSVNAYKAATNWSDYASKIQAIPA